MNFLTLHRDEARRSYFAATHPILFDRMLNCWVVSDPEEGQALLHGGALGAVPYALTYAEIEDRLGRNFPNLIFAFRHIPLCLDGEEHREARRRIAEYLSRHRTEMTEFVPNLVERSFAAFADGGEVDLVPVLESLACELVAELVQAGPVDVSVFRGASVVFDRLMSLSKRLALDAEIGRMRAVIRSRLAADASEDEEGVKLALIVLGQDALVGTLGESLQRIFADNVGLRLDAMAFPSGPVETGVPYVERLAARPFELSGTTIAAGERIRIFLQRFAYCASEDRRMRMFGIGPHACLGRQLSLDLWGRIVERLRRSSMRVEILAHELRTGDYVFTCPKRLLIRISN